MGKLYFLTFKIIIDAIKTILREYYEKINNLEDIKYDFEYIVKGKEYMVNG